MNVGGVHHVIASDRPVPPGNRRLALRMRRNKGRNIATLLIDGGGCRIGVMDGQTRWDSPAATALIRQMIRDGRARQASAGAGSRKGDA